MNFTRRHIIGAGATVGAYLGLGGINSQVIASNDTSELITKAIPSTGEQLPVIGIGTNRWVAAGSAAEIDSQRETLKVFRDMGGRVIDTAPAYRSSEKALGQLITDLGMEDAFFLATKVDREFSADGVTRMQDSLSKLNRNSVDLMQVHNLRGAQAQLETLLKWREAGKIRYIGLTTSRTDQHAEMLELMRTMPIDFIQVNYSLADRDAEDQLLPMAQEMQIAVLVNLPLARGRLFKEVSEKPLPVWAADFDCRSWAQFFLKYVVSHPAVTCAIPGTVKATHARDNMQASHGRLPDAATRIRQEALFN